MAKTKAIATIVLALAALGAPAVGAEAGAGPKAGSSPVEKARAEYEAAVKAAREAEAALAPLKNAMLKADKAYAEARKVADAKRRRAEESKKLAGQEGAEALKRAEAELATARKELEEATKAKPALDKALAEARAAVQPLRRAYEAAERALREAEAAAKAADDAAHGFDKEARLAAVRAQVRRAAAEAARSALAKARQAEGSLQKQADAAAAQLAEAQKAKAAADAALAKAKERLTAARKALKAAERAAQEAEAAAKATAGQGNRSAQEKKQAADKAAAKRKAAEAAKAAVARAQTALKHAQQRAQAAEKNLAQATAKKKAADAALAKGKKQVADAAAALEAAEQAAQAAAKTAEAKKKKAADVAAKRQALAKARAALAQAQQAEKAAKVRVAAAAKKLADAKAAGKKVAEAQAEKKAADATLAAAKKRLAEATAALQTTEASAKELLQLEAASKQAAAVVAAKRKEVRAARAALEPKQKKLEEAATRANAAAQQLARAQNRVKAADAALANLKKRIAEAKKTYQADEKAAKEAAAAAAPLKEAAEKARAAYAAAKKAVSEKWALAQQAKAHLLRLLARKRVAAVLESPDPPRPANRIDELVFAKLKSLGIQPALCSDAVFVRRAYLDLTGRLPTAEEAREFIRSSDKNKRAALVNRLLERPTHADYWAMRWSDILRIKAEFPVKLWPNAAQAYYRWVWESIAHNKPYDQFARELLTSSGSNFRVGPVNFYRAIQFRTPEGIAAAVGLALMGTRIDFWPTERRAGMAAFFSQVGYKPTSEWKEEIVFWDPLGSASLPGSTAPGHDAVAKGVAVTNQIPGALPKPRSPNKPLEAMFPDGTKVTIPPDRDPREVFADWLIRPENPWFAKAIVNRTWAWAMGRGIIHEPDDIRPDNPPSNPQLLAYLEKELVASHYDLKHLKRLIFTSTTYQLSPIPRSDRPEAEANFAYYPMRRVEAEVLIDALNQITGSSDLYTSAVPEPFTYIPKHMTAVELADGSISSPFLTLFGRSARATGMENERINELGSQQWLYMLNSAAVQDKLRNGPKLKALIASGGSPKKIVEKLYLTILSRFPTEADLAAAEAYAKSGVARGRDAWLDLAWALINSPEFLFRH